MDLREMAKLLAWGMMMLTLSGAVLVFGSALLAAIERRIRTRG